MSVSGNDGSNDVSDFTLDFGYDPNHLPTSLKKFQTKYKRAMKQAKNGQPHLAIAGYLALSTTASKLVTGEYRSWCYHSIALIYHDQLHNYNSAKTFFQLSLDHDPYYHDAYWNLARCYESLRDPHRAYRLIEMCIVCYKQYRNDCCYGHIFECLDYMASLISKYDLSITFSVDDPVFVLSSVIMKNKSLPNMNMNADDDFRRKNASKSIHPAKIVGFDDSCSSYRVELTSTKKILMCSISCLVSANFDVAHDRWLETTKNNTYCDNDNNNNNNNDDDDDDDDNNNDNNDDDDNDDDESNNNNDDNDDSNNSNNSNKNDNNDKIASITHDNCYSNVDDDDNDGYHKKKNKRISEHETSCRGDHDKKIHNRDRKNRRIDI